MKNTLLHRTPAQRYVLGGLLSAAALLAFSLSTTAQTPGSLDDNFSADGSIAFNAYPSFISIQGGTIDVNGRIVVVGNVTINGDQRIYLARLHADGTLDDNYAPNGQTYVSSFSLNGSLNDALALPDCKYMACGTAGDDFALFRFNSNTAVPDPTFQQDGYKLVSFGGTDVATAMAADADGKYVVVGYSSLNGNSYFAAARFTANGTLDTSFDVDGKRTIDYNGIGLDRAYAVGLQADGKIIIAGTTGSMGDARSLVCRLNQNGSLDLSFGNNGWIDVLFGNNTVWDESCSSICVLSDDRFLIGGSQTGGAAGSFLLAKFASNGTLDPNFGIGGYTIVTTQLDLNLLYSLLIQGDGKIVAAGNGVVTSRICRFEPNGELDLTFGTDGWAGENFPYGRISDLHLDAYGRIIAIGDAIDFGNSYDAMVLRYLSGLNVGMVELSLESSLLIYPNPIQESATLRYTLAEAEELTIALQDLQGRALVTYLNSKDMPTGEHTQTITMPSDLASGNYLLVFSSPKGKMSVQVSK
ncbi:MAG: T9SS type A sorting domain-containing protein [Flavobacteriales bacterium]|nr:T9SS type A sorting domain-containing protein [Flavobacteriales bacterium]